MRGATIVLVLVAVGCAAPSAMTEERSWQICQERMTSTLSESSTADYPALDEVEVTEHDDGWEIRGWVEVEDATDGPVRADFDCTVEHVSGDNYRVTLQQH